LALARPGIAKPFLQAQPPSDLAPCLLLNPIAAARSRPHYPRLFPKNREIGKCFSEKIMRPAVRSPLAKTIKKGGDKNQTRRGLSRLVEGFRDGRYPTVNDPFLQRSSTNDANS
jgi:hypothetical protein